MTHHGHFLFTRFAMLATVAAMGACAKNPSPSADPSTPPATRVDAQPIATESAVTGNNVRAYIDPATGQLREPTREELAAEAAAEAAKKNASGAQQKPAEMKEVQLPNGAVAIELGDSAQQPLKACVGKDGDVKMDHACEAESPPKK